MKTENFQPLPLHDDETPDNNSLQQWIELSHVLVRGFNTFDGEIDIVS